MSNMSKPSVPVSQQANEAAEAAYDKRSADQIARGVAIGEEALAAKYGRPGSILQAGDPGYAEAMAAGARVAAPVELKRFAVELRYGPQMMNAAAEVSAPSIDTIMATITAQGGLRLTSKLPTSSPSGTSFQKGAFIFTQSIHSVVVLEELR